MSIEYKDIKNVRMFPTFEEFCKNNTNCHECDLRKNELINTDYGQPCRQVYELVLLIDDFATMIKGQDVLIKGYKKGGN